MTDMDKEQIAALVKRLREACSCNIETSPCMAGTECRDAIEAADALEALSRQIDAARAAGFAEARKAAELYHVKQMKRSERAAQKMLLADHIRACDARADLHEESAAVMRSLQPKERT